MTVRYVTVVGFLAYHAEVMLQSGQPSVLVSRERLEAAVARPQTQVFGVEAFPTLADKAAALIHAVARSHPFLDGNKRAALGAMLASLELNGVPIAAGETALYDFVISVATGELSEIPDIATSIRRLFSPHLA